MTSQADNCLCFIVSSLSYRCLIYWRLCLGSYLNLIMEDDADIMVRTLLMLSSALYMTPCEAIDTYLCVAYTDGRQVCSGVSCCLYLYYNIILPGHLNLLRNLLLHSLICLRIHFHVFNSF